MALIRARPKANDGRLIYRGAVIDPGDIGGSEPMVLRGFTSCSRVEARALDFISRSASSVPVASSRPGAVRTPRSGVGVPVMFEIRLPRVEFKDAQLGNLWVGPGVCLRNHAAFEDEDEVVLMDGTMVHITDVQRDSVTPFNPELTSPYPIPCLQVRAEVKWDRTVEYFKIFVEKTHISAPVSTPTEIPALVAP